MWCLLLHQKVVTPISLSNKVGFHFPITDREKLMPTMLQWCFSSKSDKYQTSEIELEEKGNETKTPDQNEKKERKPASRVCNVIIKD